MRLFQITDLHTRKPIEGLYFSNKRAAKAKRSELNGDLEAQFPPKFRYIVSPGPDHKRYVK